MALVVYDDDGLEDGEISDIQDEDLRPVNYNVSMGSFSCDGWQEKEVGDMISEEMTRSSELNNTRRDRYLSISSDDEMALRIAALKSAKRPVVMKKHSSEEDGEIDEDISNERTRGRQCSSIQSRRRHSSNNLNNQSRFAEHGHSSAAASRSRSGWVPLQRLVRTEEKDAVVKKVCEPKFPRPSNERALYGSREPLQVTLRNGTMERQINVPEMTPRLRTDHNTRFDDLLHMIRTQVEDRVFGKKGVLVDNYDEIGMDIVESDRESGAGAANTSCDVPRTTDNDDEAEKLRAFLLAQVRKNSKKQKITDRTQALEEGEIRDDNGNGNNDSRSVNNDSIERGSARYSASNLYPNDTDTISSARSHRKRSKRSCESESDDESVEGHSSSPSRRFSEKRSKTVREWEDAIDKEKRHLEDIDRKIRRRDFERVLNVKKQKKFQSRADACAHYIGKLEGEMNILKGDKEKIRGRLSYLKRQYEKARSNISRREPVRNLGTRDCQTTKQKVESVSPNNEQLFGASWSEGKTVPTSTSPFSSEIIVSPHLSSKSSLISPKSPEVTLVSESTSCDKETEAPKRDADPLLPKNEMKLTTQDTSDDEASDALTIVDESDEECSKENVEKDLSKLKDNPLIMLSDYRWSSTFPLRLVKFPAVSNKIDPMKPFCPYQLTGICKDATCPWQHEEEYLLTDEELVCSFLNHFPCLCPSGKTTTSFARDLLEEHRELPVHMLISSLLHRVPDADRVIRIHGTDISHSSNAHEEEEEVVYSIPHLCP